MLYNLVGDIMKKYLIKEYIEILRKNNLIKELINVDEILEKQVNHFSYNSKDIKENTLFICKGATFKEEYLQSAINEGSFAYIADKKYDVDIPAIIVENIRDSLAICSRMYFNNPDESLKIIGITGTKGKSTTLYYIKNIINKFLKDNKKEEMAYLSTIETYDGKSKYESLLSTPESYELYKNFRNAVDSGIENVVMEVSSQSLKYNRLGELFFDISLFLNIGEDHISDVEHPNFEDYFESKLKIFEKSKITCINLDDKCSKQIIKRAKDKENKIITFSCLDSKANVYVYDIQKEGISTIFKVRTDKFDTKFELSMPGLFNVYNALAAISVAIHYNIPEKYIIAGLKEARVPGRMELYKSKDEKILSIVDYAHNKLSFEKIYETTKKEYPSRKIVTIFGCPGSKAKSRRKDLGIESGKNSDYIYLTADDPAYEEVVDISNEVAEYIKKYNKNYTIIEDRETSIKEAVKFILNQKDSYILLILGKGNEDRQKVKGGLQEYLSDAVCIKNCIREYEKINYFIKF